MGHENPFTRGVLFGQAKLANELFGLCESNAVALRSSIESGELTDVREEGLHAPSRKMTVDVSQKAKEIRLPNDRQFSHAAQKRMGLIGRCETVGESKVGHAFHQHLQRNSTFDSSERRSNAVVDTAPERKMRSDASALDGELVGVAVVRFVTIAR